MQAPDYPILPPLPSPTITPTAARAYFEGDYRAWEEICRLNGILQPHQTIPHPSTMHSSLPPSGPSNPPLRPSNPPPRQGPPPTRAPNPLNPRQNRPSAPSTISRPVTGARVQRTFQGQVHRKMEDVQCFNCKELGHPLKYCTVVGNHGFIYGCPRCNAGQFYDSGTNRKKRTNDEPLLFRLFHRAGNIQKQKWQLGYKCPSSYSTLKAGIASQILIATGGFSRCNVIVLVFVREGAVRCACRVQEYICIECSL
jgi:hypothetical protein